MLGSTAKEIVQLWATVEANSTQIPQFQQLNPRNGASVPFSLPQNQALFVSDISAFPFLGPGFAPNTNIRFSLMSEFPGQSVRRWGFQGWITQNIERSYATPIVFCSAPSVQFTADPNPAPNPQIVLNVILYGYLDSMPPQPPTGVNASVG